MERLISNDSNSEASRRPRRSACAARSRQEELERLRQMSVEERISAALTIRKRFEWIKPTVKVP